MRRHQSTLFITLAAALAVTGCKDSNAPDKPGAPTDVRVSAGDAQTGRAGSVLAAPIAVKVTDAKGRGVPNIEVAFQALANSGSVLPIAARTNGSGIATTSWTMPTAAGVTASVRAVFVDTLTGALVDSATFSAKVIGGLPASIGRGNDTPFRGATGSPVTLQAIVLDQYYNRSPNSPIAWRVTSGGGTLSAASTLSDSLGVARVTLTLGANPGMNEVSASYGTLTAPFAIDGKVAGQVTAMYANQYPGVVPVGGTVPLAVTVLDGLDHGIAGQTIAWTRVTGDGTLSAASSVTDGNGVARVNYTLGNAAAVHSISATLGSRTVSFSMEGRNIAQRLAYLSSGGYGIGRSSGGRFVASLLSAATVQTFDEASPDVKRTITVGGTPVIVAVDPAGAYAYVSNMSGWIDVINVAASTTQQVLVPGAHSLTLSPRGDRVYVASYNGKVYSVNTATRQLVDSVTVPNGPWGIAFRSTASDSIMYVTARDGGTVTEIDMKTTTVLRTFTVGGRPHGLVISPDGQTLYTADDGQGQVKVISTSTGAVTGVVTLAGAFGIAISPDGSTLFVTTDNARAAVITTSNMVITKLYDTLRNARQIIVSPDGTTAWSGNEGGWVDAIKK